MNKRDEEDVLGDTLVDFEAGTPVDEDESVTPHEVSDSLAEARAAEWDGHTVGGLE